MRMNDLKRKIVLSEYWWSLVVAFEVARLFSDAAY